MSNDYKTKKAVDVKNDNYGPSVPIINDSTPQTTFQELLSRISVFNSDKYHLSTILKQICDFIDENEEEIVPYLPISMEMFFYYQINILYQSIQDIPILSLFFKIISFITRDKNICQRFIEIDFHSLLIRNLLFANKFSQKYSNNLVFSIFHLVDQLLSENKETDSNSAFFHKYPISSFIESRIDMVDKINFLVCFSKYSFDREITFEIIKLTKMYLVEELAAQSAWIMYYTAKSNIDNIDVLFVLDDFQSDLFSKISKYLGSKIVDESFYIPYLRFCNFVLRHLDENDDPFQRIISYEIPSKILSDFDLASSSQEFIEVLIRFLNIIFAYNEDFFNEDLIFDIIDISKKLKFSIVNQVLLLLNKVISIWPIEFVTMIFRSEFFIDCLEAINANIDIVLLSETIFLIFKRIQPIPELFDEYISLHVEYETVEAFQLAKDHITGKNAHNLDCLIKYWDEMQNAITSLDESVE